MSNKQSRTRLVISALKVSVTLLLCLPTMASALAWTAITPQQQQALAPLAGEWDTLSEKQQKNFIGIAKRYPHLTPMQQQRVQQRLVRWGKLTPAQREKAREKYKSFNRLPPEKREAVKQTLRERHAQKLAPASAVQAVTPSH